MNQFHGNFLFKTLSCRKIKSFFMDVKWCVNASWGLKGLEAIIVWVNPWPFKPSQCIEASFYILENRLNSPTTEGFRINNFMKLFYQYMAIFCNFYTTLTHHQGGGPRVVVRTVAFHARVRGSVPGLGGLKETKMFLPHPRVKVSIVGSLRDREIACSASDRQGSNLESCVWRTVSSQSSHQPQEVLLAQFSLYVHKGGLKPDSFHLTHLHALQGENCDGNSRLVVDEDDNGKLRLEKVKRSVLKQLLLTHRVGVETISYARRVTILNGESINRVLRNSAH